jgi:polar amino acid transport system substrate-binding protein
MIITRRNWAPWAAACAALAFGAASAQTAGESTMARVERTKTLRVGVVAGAVPYFSKDLLSGKWEGFGPDFAESLAKKLGAKVEFLETTWGNAVLDLESNKIDAMFGMAPSPARREVVNFSDTLFENTYTVVCKKGYAPKTWEQLNAPDVKVAVDLGSSHDQLATKILPKAELLRVENSGAATMSLQAGRADCQILVVLLAQPLLAKRPEVGTMYIPTPVQTNSVNIGLQKEADPTFQKAVNAWLAEVRAKDEVRGVILKNMQKLAGVSPQAFPKEIRF